MLKKGLVVLLVIILLSISVVPVFAGGDKNTGDTGEGNTHENFENSCEDQPCFDVAERPQNKNRP